MSKKKLAQGILDMMMEAEQGRKPGGWFLVQAAVWNTLKDKCEKVLEEEDES